MLPIYDIVLGDAPGIDAIALVEHPAVEVDFLKFDADKKIELEKLRFYDDEKHVITGISLLADTAIYRYDNVRGEYYVIFSKDVIKQLVEKYSKDGLFNSVNRQHVDEDVIKNITLTESYFIDKERGICPNEFAECPNGSWVTSFKVNDQTTWEQIKSGELKGFSIQGIFELELQPESFIDWLEELLNELM